MDIIQKSLRIKDNEKTRILYLISIETTEVISSVESTLLLLISPNYEADQY